MTRTGADAEAYARSRVGTNMPDAGLCLQCTRENFAIPALYGSAEDAWQYATNKHTGRPPAGSVVPVFWNTPSVYNHVATYLSNGQVVTTNGARIELWSSIDAITSAFGGPYQGWSEDLNGVRVYGSNEPTPEPPEKTVTYIGKTTSKDMALPAGAWKTLRISDEGDLSLLVGPCNFSALIQVDAENLPPGDQLAIRYKLIDVKDGEDSVRVSSYKPTEIVGTGGTTQGQAAQLGSIGKPASGWSRRLRAEALTYADGVVLTSVQARSFH